MTTFVFAEEEYKPSKSKKNPRRQGSSRTTRQPVSYPPHETSQSFTSDTSTSFSAHHSGNNRLNNNDPPYGAARKGPHIVDEMSDRLHLAGGYTSSTTTSTSSSSGSTGAVMGNQDVDKMEIEGEEEELVSPRIRPKGSKSTQAVLLNFPSNEYNSRNSNSKPSSIQSVSNRSLSSNCSEEPSLYGAQFLSPSVRGAGPSSRLAKNKHHPNMRTPTRGSNNMDLATDSFSYAEDSLAYSLDDTVEFSPRQITNAHSPTCKPSPSSSARKIGRLQSSTVKTSTKTEVHNLTLHEIEGEDDEVSVKTADSSHHMEETSSFKKPEMVERRASSLVRPREKGSTSQSHQRHKSSSNMHGKESMQRTVSLSSSEEEVPKSFKPNNKKTQHRRSTTSAQASKSSRTPKKLDKKGNDTVHSECPKLFYNQWWMCGFADALLSSNKTR
jgi:hypothetical protein